MPELGVPVTTAVRDAFFAQHYNVRRPAARPALVSQNSGAALGGAGVGTMAQPNMLTARKGPGAKRIVPRSTPLLPLPNQAMPQPQLQANAFAGQAMNGAFPPQLQLPATANAFANAPTFNTPPPPNAGWGGAVAGSSSSDVANKKRKAVDAGPSYTGNTYNGRDSQFVIIDDGGAVPGYGNHPRLSAAPYRAAGNTLGTESRDAPIEIRVLRPEYAPREREVTFAVSNKLRDENERGLRVLAVPKVVTYGKLRVEDSGFRDTLEYRNFGEGDREFDVVVRAAHSTDIATGKGSSEVSVTAVDKTLWVDYLPHYVVCIAGSQHFAAVSTEEGALVVYSPTGRRLLPTLVLDSPCSFLVAEGHYLMAITAYGTLSVWDTSKSRAVFSPLNVSSLLTSSATSYAPHPTITTSALLPNGAPLLSLSSGTSHSYDRDLCAWTRVSEAWWSKGSDFWEGRRGKAAASGASGAAGLQSGRGIVRTIEAAINEIVVDASKEETEDESSDDDGAADSVVVETDDDSVSRKDGADATDTEDARMTDGDSANEIATALTSSKGKERAKSHPAPPMSKGLKGKGWEIVVEPRRKRKKRLVPLEGAEKAPVGDDSQRRTAIGLAHLETRIKAAAALDSPAEYKGFLLQYAKKLGEAGLRSKAEELVRELVGPIY